MIAIIDYGLGNIQSLKNAINSLGYNAVLTCDRNEILNSSKVILPGVGAFQEGMRNIRDKGLVQTIKDYSDLGKPILGICLGYQLMNLSSDEFGHEEGLGLLPGICKKLEPARGERLPHIGWAPVEFVRKSDWGELVSGHLFYFVHSYGVLFDDNECIDLGVTKFGDREFASFVKKNNIYGMQFHPEKSGEVGLALLDNFLKQEKK